MKKHSLWYNRKFNVNNHAVVIDLFSRCTAFNPQEKSYRKKLCKVIFLDSVKKNNKEYVQICFSSMRAAVVFITNHIDTNSMKLNIFGKQYLAHLTVLSCNYKLHTINSIDNKDVWETFIESNLNE
jgi:hypothetical protein